MDSESMQKPVADERADDADRRVADEPKPTASDNLARHCRGLGREQNLGTGRVLSPLRARFANDQLAVARTKSRREAIISSIGARGGNGPGNCLGSQRHG
jgi:hypothetical protein